MTIIMRVFATSDLHLDYDDNKRWLEHLSTTDYQSDILILAGDISDDITLLTWCFSVLQSKFQQVFFVPGNHDLWVRRSRDITSIDKFEMIRDLANEYNIRMTPHHYGSLSIVPLLSWYDYSFGLPCEKLLKAWMDFHVCDWPNNMQANDISHYFLSLNQPVLSVQNDVVISFSHFMPRIDLMPSGMPQRFKYLYPIMGSAALDEQIRTIQSTKHLHIYGHSHLNRQVVLEGIEYTNNAFGYPSESHISQKQLRQIYETPNNKK